MTANIDAALTAWFGRVEVVRDGRTDFESQRRYMFGYTPHGLFPIGAHNSLHPQYVYQLLARLYANFGNVFCAIVTIVYVLQLLAICR